MCGLRDLFNSIMQNVHKELFLKEKRKEISVNFLILQPTTLTCFAKHQFHLQILQQH